MRLFVILVILSIILISGCITEHDKSYYSQFKNPNLTYSWDFSDTLTDKYGNTVGGGTPNSTYFQLKRYSFLETGYCTPPYEIQYKHEEGHIFTFQLLKIDNMENFLNYTHNNSNLSITFNDFLIYFGVPVSEGIADYYAISYFNNSLSNDYFYCLEQGVKLNNSRSKQHYQGYMFVNYALKNKLYSNFTDLILDLGSVRQYNYYTNFSK